MVSYSLPIREFLCACCRDHKAIGASLLRPDLCASKIQNPIICASCLDRIVVGCVGVRRHLRMYARRLGVDPERQRPLHQNGQLLHWPGDPEHRDKRHNALRRYPPDMETSAALIPKSGTQRHIYARRLVSFTMLPIYCCSRVLI